jgi:hypothetical protein
MAAAGSELAGGTAPGGVDPQLKETLEDMDLGEEMGVKTELTADQAWGLVEPGVETQDMYEMTGLSAIAPSMFRDAFLCKMKGIYDTFGGPRQFLNRRFSTPELKQEFALHLFQTYMMRDNLEYTFGELLEGKVPDPPQAIFHVAMLTFDNEGSIKGNPLSATSMLLVDEFVTHGFITQGDPLLVAARPQLQKAAVRSPWASLCRGSSCTPFSVGYIKGQARTTTLLSCLAVLFEEGVNVAEARQRAFTGSANC